MNAWCVNPQAEKGQLLQRREIAISQPGANELLIQVFAAGVTPTELAWYPTAHTAAGAVRENAVPGHEFSGMVADVGKGVTQFRAGDEVFGMNSWYADGATAEYCLTTQAEITLKPKSLSHAQAAAVPIGALTAWQGLLEKANVKAEERVLVHGGSGAVGLFAVQIAHQQGAYVVATASAAHLDVVRSLGADQVLDYKAEPFELAVRNLDVIFDAVGGETLQRSWTLLAPEGRLVTIAASEEAAPDARTKQAFFIVEPNRQQLTEAAELLVRGKLRVFAAAEVGFESANAAYANSVERSGPGKVVIRVRD